MGINRRRLMELAAAVAAGARIGAAQGPPSQGAAPQTPDAALQSARNQLRRQAQRVAAVPLPQATEPAVHFRA